MARSAGDAAGLLRWSDEDAGGLLADSPAIDAGLNNVPAGNMDQRGFKRNVDDPNTPNGPSGTIDIGAFEFAGAPIIVSTLVDESDGNFLPGDLSLREAIDLAVTLPGNDTITFSTIHPFNLFAAGPATMMLAYDGPDSGTAPDQLTLGTNVTIDGPGANQLSISGNFQTRVFNVNSDVTAKIRNLRITGGALADGAGIYNSGTLTVDGADRWQFGAIGGRRHRAKRRRHTDDFEQHLVEQHGIGRRRRAVCHQWYGVGGEQHVLEQRGQWRGRRHLCLVGDHRLAKQHGDVKSRGRGQRHQRGGFAGRAIQHDRGRESECIGGAGLGRHLGQLQYGEQLQSHW